MVPLDATLTRKQALELNEARSVVRKPVTYMVRFDQDVFRLGSQDDSRLDRVRYLEDSRPLQRKNKVTGELEDKANEIITYNEDDVLYVLGKSGGVSLFSGQSPKLKLNKNDRWHLIPKGLEVPDGLIIAKDKQVDRYGHFHYAIQPDRDMTMVDFIRRLEGVKADKRIKVI